VISLKQELINGLTSCGINVFDAGLGPTPMLYFAVYHQKADAGIMITGSHNPKDHNGFKIMLNNKPFFGDEILKLAEITKQNNFIIFTKKVVLRVEGPTLLQFEPFIIFRSSIFWVKKDTSMGL
jgi:phosphomannomutase